MITKDIKSYLANNYSEYLESISELSKICGDKSLVKDNRKLYNFDKITQKIYEKNLPQSVDSVYASSKKIFFIEYKTGFKKKINRNNFDKERMKCPYIGKYCKDYGKLFFRNQTNEDTILRNSLQLKAIESYTTFMEQIVSKSREDENHIRKSLIYCVVVDDYVSHMENILDMLADRKSDTNIIEGLKKSLSRFQKTENKDYYFDEIKVFSPHDFREFVTRNME